ncbi:ribonuclease R [Nostoc sp. CHAB 5834]|nr:ribonuclease R [Nostoc sp. CHAB 5834]
MQQINFYLTAIAGTSYTLNMKNKKRHTGVVTAHPKGFGFAVDTEGLKHYIPHFLMSSLIPGDVIDFELAPGRQRDSVQVKYPVILERPESIWLGTLEERGGQHFLVPDEPCFIQMVLPSLVFVQEGCVVAVKVAQQKAPVPQPAIAVTLTQVLGQRDRPFFDSDYAKAKYDFAPYFTPAEILEAESMPSAVQVSDSHQDMRDIPFVTVDGESTKDFDDAVWGTKTESGWHVRVAITDVSFYVKPGTALDAGAKSRGLSLYLPNEVTPMLPEVLSTGLCSLIPGADRYALVLQLELDHNGAVVSKKLSRAVIRSKARLTYTEVQAWNDGLASFDPDVLSSLQALWPLYEQLEKLRDARGKLSFEDKEPYATYREDNTVEITTRERTAAHKFIEELMLMANESAAQLLAERGLPALYRFQEGPPTEDWLELVEWAQLQAVDVGPKPSMQSMANLVKKVPDDLQLQASLRVRGCMNPALYASEDSSHYSLGYSHYTHFTSPIRRYADLVVHRLLVGESTASAQAIADVAAQCSKRSKAAKMAERLVWDKLKKRAAAADTEHRDSFSAYIAVISDRSVRVVLDAWNCIASLSTRELEELGYAYNEDRNEWFKDEKHLQLGSRLTVRLQRLSESGNRTELQVALVSEYFQPAINEIVEVATN